MNKFVSITIFLSFWYITCFNVFIVKNNTVGDSPQLRARFGTMLSHSSDIGGDEHLYCYYPKGNTTYHNKSGEYIIKRAENINECNYWFGAVVFNEGWWVSEKEKLWWSDKQKLGDELARLNQKQNPI